MLELWTRSIGLLEHGAGILIGMTVTMLLLYQAHWLRRAERRRAKGLCPRCGRRPLSAAGGDLEYSQAYCESCARQTRFRHGAGFCFFVGIALVLAAAVVYGVTLDMRNGVPVTLGSIARLMIFGVGAPVALAIWIRVLMKHDQQGR